MSEIVCPNCSFHFVAEVPRHGKRGEGAWYSQKIKKLSQGHTLALEILKGHDCYETGLGLTDVWKKTRDYCLQNNLRVPTKQGMSGRLSELQGKGLVRSENNQIRLVESQSQQYRFEKQPRWFLAK